MTGPGAFSRGRPVSPYKGLAPFDDSELDALFFFGREQETEIVTANLVAARLTVLYGQSGVGKSSLLRAAVARELRLLPERPVVVVFDEWSDDPAAALSAAIAEEAGVEPGTSLVETVERALGERAELYLALDQFEAYFLYHGRGRPDEPFAEAFPELVNRGDLRIHVVVGIREDALAQLDFFKSRIPALFGNYLRLDHLDREKARSALVGPVRRWEQLGGEPVTIEAELVEAVLDEVTAGRVALGGGGRGTIGNGTAPKIETPYLQLVMQRLWDEDPTALRLETLRRLGGAARIVGDHLDEALGVLSESQKASAALMFDHLVTPSGTKIVHGAGDLAEFAHAPPAEVMPILHALAEERILRPVADGGGDGYEIYHDVLADAVLDWRTRFEAQRELEHARSESERRRRQALRIADALARGARDRRRRRDLRADPAPGRSDAGTERSGAGARRHRGRAAADRSRARTAPRPRRRSTLGCPPGGERPPAGADRLACPSDCRPRAPGLECPVREPLTDRRRRHGDSAGSRQSMPARGKSSTRSRRAPSTLRSTREARQALAYGRGGARWYRLPDGAPGRELAAPRIMDVAYSRDGAELVTLHRDRRLRLWRLGAAKPTRTILLPDAPVSAAVSSARPGSSRRPRAAR